MKSSWSLICFVIALMVMATVDRVPDPPAAKPDLVQFAVSNPHEIPALLTRPFQFLISAFWQSERTAVFQPFEPVLLSNRIHPLERATDPSPPASRS
jgi:hypothetical protein